MSLQQIKEDFKLILKGGFWSYNDKLMSVAEGEAIHIDYAKVSNSVLSKESDSGWFLLVPIIAVVVTVLWSLR